MEQGFNVASLFSVSQGCGSISHQELNKAKRLCKIEKTELNTDNIQNMVERENAFVEQYQNEIDPWRKERNGQDKERLERHSLVRTELMEEED